jgi:sodium/potassium-transporting ATPase subunit alpha
MTRPPRGRRGRLLDTTLLLRSYLFLGLVETAWAMSMFFLTLHLGGWQYGQSLAGNDPLYLSATGVTLISVVFTQVGSLIGRRYETRSGLDRGLLRNPLFVIGIALEIAFAVAVVYVPSLGRALGTGPISPWLLGLAALGAPVLFLADWLRKRVALGRTPSTPRPRPAT